MVDSYANFADEYLRRQKRIMQYCLSDPHTFAYDGEDPVIDVTFEKLFCDINTITDL
jgi:hypothetical protein